MIARDIRFSATVFHTVWPKKRPVMKSSKFSKPTHLLPAKPLSSLKSIKEMDREPIGR